MNPAYAFIKCFNQKCKYFKKLVVHQVLKEVSKSTVYVCLACHRKYKHARGW